MSNRRETTEELRGLSKRLAAKGENTSGRSGEQIGRYQALAEKSRQNPALADALLEKAFLLGNQGRLCEAILTIEPHLMRNPWNYAIAVTWRRVRDKVHDDMLQLADKDPESAEFGRTYEKLLAIGHVSNHLHIGAVRHYMASGNFEKAVERLLAVARVAPGAPGVAELVFRLAATSDDVQIQQLALKYREIA